MYVKGVADDSDCSGASLCELCARRIYRTTSADLLTWTEPELVLEEVSLPVLYAGAGGAVTLLWKDFAAVCEAEDLDLGRRAPIRMATESSGSLGAVSTLSFPEEAFETDATLHYAGITSPVLLSGQSRIDAFDACLLHGVLE